MRKQMNSLEAAEVTTAVKPVVSKQEGEESSLVAIGLAQRAAKVFWGVGVSTCIFGGALLACSLSLVTAALVSDAVAAPIYVVKEADGSIRFTDRKPADSKNAKVFTSSGNNFGHYSIAPSKAKLWSRGAGRHSTVSHRSRQYESVIAQASQANNLDPALVKAVIHAESSFNPQAISRNGAIGLMQLMPTTAKRLGVRPHVPEENIKGGVRYLSNLIRAFKGNLKLALAAYNAGEGVVRRYQGIPPYEETQTYVRKVLALRDVYLTSGQSAQG